MNSRTRARAHEGVTRLSGAKLDLPELFLEATRLLATALPHDTACWHTMDPATLIETGAHFENMPRADAHVAKIAYLSDDYNNFVQLAQGRRHSGVLSEETGGQPDRSPRYRELLRPQNFWGELRTAFVVDGACWGCFAFFREAPADFSTDERDFAHQLSSLLGRAFRAAGVQGRATGAGALWPGLLLLNGRREVESVNAPAQRWLEELGFDGAPERDPLPFALLAVAERVRASAGEASTRVRGKSGTWIQLHASPASGSAEPGRVAIILQAATPPAIAPLISAAYGFTSRERELIELVLQGSGTAEIAARLFISPHTVQGHLKSIFAKAGVRSRRELVTRVFVRHEASALL
ncbi:MAG TPA: helix-turn-helix transcriptional regulator [Pseudonocardia sp.]|uniref:helix-turn-helix transcriptional regulator n=1 Tax=Pseudonocardia sp. TaxID=60912 RepID=UPI002EDA6A7F